MTELQKLLLERKALDAKISKLRNTNVTCGSARFQRQKMGHAMHPSVIEIDRYCTREKAGRWVTVIDADSVSGAREYLGQLIHDLQELQKAIADVKEVGDE